MTSLRDRVTFSENYDILRLNSRDTHSKISWEFASLYQILVYKV